MCVCVCVCVCVKVHSHMRMHSCTDLHQLTSIQVDDTDGTFDQFIALHADVDVPQFADGIITQATAGALRCDLIIVDNVVGEDEGRRRVVTPYNQQPVRSLVLGFLRDFPHYVAGVGMNFYSSNKHKCCAHIAAL